MLETYDLKKKKKKDQRFSQSHDSRSFKEGNRYHKSGDKTVRIGNSRLHALALFLDRLPPCKPESPHVLTEFLVVYIKGLQLSPYHCSPVSKADVRHYFAIAC